MKMSEAKKMAEQRQDALGQAKVAGIMETVNASFEALVENPLRNQLPENVFRESFLPYFTGKGDPNAGQRPLTDWIAIAGSPTAPVDIVNAAGEVIFTVPSMMDSSGINVRGTKGKNLGDMVHDYQLHGDHLPGAQQRYYQNVMEGKLDQMVPTHTDESAAGQAWSKIFKHYGLTQPDQGQKQDNKPDNGSDDLVYD
jgi:hypothetical protein